MQIAIFASGAGSNAERIIQYSQEGNYTVKLIVSSHAEAGVLHKAAKAGIDTYILNKHDFLYGSEYLQVLQQNQITHIVLAGFIWKVPSTMIAQYPKKIINIHPALLPLYGGKGMYGKYVHEAVLADKQTVSGITIHEVDEQYDHGAIIFQATCSVSTEDSIETLAHKIHQLEHTHYPQVIASWIHQNEE